MTNWTGSLNTTLVSIGKKRKGPDCSEPHAAFPRRRRLYETRWLRGGRLGVHADRNGRGGRLFRVERALSAEDAALVDDQRADDDVAKDLTGGQDLEAARGVHVALDAATDDHVAASDVAFDAATLADRQVAFRRQVTVHFAVEPDVGR